MKTIRRGSFGLSVLLLSVNGLAQNPPAIPGQFFPFPEGFKTGFGNLPLADSTNLLSIPVAVAPYYENALILDTANRTPAFLNYNVLDTVPTAHKNLNYPAGTVLFYFAPGWASVSQGGTGPGQTACFVGGGDWRSNSPNGLLAICADAGGSNLYFGGEGPGGAVTYARAPISWGSNTFHQVGVEWSQDDCEIYLDGALAATGNGVTIVPARSTWTNGFFIGSDDAGYEQARGAFWAMVTWTSEYGAFYTNGWLSLSNAIVSWQTGQQEGGFQKMGGLAGPLYQTNSYNTNDLWLEMRWLSSVSNELVIHTPWYVTNGVYHILTTTNLAPPIVWQRFTTTAPGQTNIPLTNTTEPQRFFALGLTNSSAGTDFWVAYLDNFGQANLSLYISSQETALGTVGYSRFFVANTGEKGVGI